MFNKIKALKDVRHQAKQIEKVLENISATGSAKGVTVVINGKQEVTSVTIADDVAREDIADAVKRAMNEATKDIQKQAQKAIKEAGGLPDLSQFGM
ncbi:YbaB/EbfC family nucleoid-associated protein [Candidatus Uhrbacteria bacterium]|nr:YbaB/EbfC family nucleoid-associated protein [Candidatus Uhrbacteria bacterium]